MVSICGVTDGRGASAMASGRPDGVPASQASGDGPDTDATPAVTLHMHTAGGVGDGDVHGDVAGSTPGTGPLQECREQVAATRKQLAVFWEQPGHPEVGGTLPVLVLVSLLFIPSTDKPKQIHTQTPVLAPWPPTSW